MRKKSHPIRNFFILVIFAGLVYLGYYVFNDTDVFIIKDIHIIGNHHVAENEVLEYLATQGEIHYFKVNPYELKSLIELHPWIKSCEVKKIFPNKLEIKMVERVPVVAIYYSETYLLVDESLYVLSATQNPGAYYPVYGYEINSFSEGKPILANNWRLLENIINTVYMIHSSVFVDKPELYVENEEIYLKFTDTFKATLGDGNNLAFRFYEVSRIYVTLMDDANQDISKIHGIIKANTDVSAAYDPFGE
ncbi:MAG: FtsQ-type POTRA domain-containing protein [Clostridia bacterium]|nr:FtsQ-type POTRA domain-containing protein [Clostridia bacterium]